MRIEIVEKNCKASEKLLAIVNKKVSRLDKYFDEDALCSIYFKTENRLCKTEVTILYKGNMVRAEVAGKNFYDNIDSVLPKLEKQIYKHKGKLESKLKQGAFAEKQLFFKGEVPAAEGTPVKVKTFDLTPMTNGRGGGTARSARAQLLYLPGRRNGRGARGLPAQQRRRRAADPEKGEVSAVVAAVKNNI